MNVIIIAAVAVAIIAVSLMMNISKPKSSDDDMAEYSKSKGDKKAFSKPSLKKGFQEEASVKCMVANATCSRLKYMDFKGDILIEVIYSLGCFIALYKRKTSLHIGLFYLIIL